MLEAMFAIQPTSVLAIVVQRILIDNYDGKINSNSFVFCFSFAHVITERLTFWKSEKDLMELRERGIVICFFVYF